MVRPWTAGLTLPPPTQTETPMFAKTILALVLAGVSLSFVANASAAPKRAQQQIEFYQTDYRGSPADTNGIGN
jgi:hypothetical protein